MAFAAAQLSRRGLPRARHLRSLPHVRQSFNYDCGLACVEMMLRALGVAPIKCSLPALQNALVQNSGTPHSSIWTIDLAHILRNFEIQCRFLTTNPGVNPSFRRIQFYQQTIEADARRVQRLFESAAARGIHIETQSVVSAQLQAIVGDGANIVILLVDRRRLYSGVVGGAGLVEALAQCVLTSYIGHYVCLTGYDAQTGCYSVHDPAQAAESGLLRVHVADVDSARLAHGTDEDMLVIPWEQLATAAGGGDEPTGATQRGASPDVSLTGTVEQFAPFGGGHRSFHSEAAPPHKQPGAERLARELSCAQAALPEAERRFGIVDVATSS